MDDEKLQFSYAKAYSYFKEAAEQGHTMAAYNIAVMHYTGLGTYKSCSLALTFIRHVANVGPQALELKKAHSLFNQGRFIEAAFLYLELAETSPIAILNSALLLDRHSVFNSENSFFSSDVRHINSEGQVSPVSLDINKFISFNAFKLALNFKETQNESFLKLADTFKYGLQPLEVYGGQSVEKAAHIYKFIEE